MKQGGQRGSSHALSVALQAQQEELCNSPQTSFPLYKRISFISVDLHLACRGCMFQLAIPLFLNKPILLEKYFTDFLRSTIRAF